MLPKCNFHDHHLDGIGGEDKELVADPKPGGTTSKIVIAQALHRYLQLAWQVQVWMCVVYMANASRNLSFKIGMYASQLKELFFALLEVYWLHPRNRFAAATMCHSDIDQRPVEQE